MVKLAQSITKEMTSHHIMIPIALETIAILGHLGFLSGTEEFTDIYQKCTKIAFVYFSIGVLANIQRL